MDSVLRPRDIQARIRAGETPEAVAAVAQTTVEKVMVFATPVLAERAWVAEQAQKASVRRRVGNGPVGHLGEAVAARLTDEDVAPEAVAWDAWRREDGRWTLVAAFAATDGNDRRATFVYDTAGRYVVADDEEARRLVGEQSTTGPFRGLDEDAQTALGDDAIELVTGRRPEPVAEPEPVSDPPARFAAPTPVPDPAPVAGDGTADLTSEATVDLTDTVRAARAARPSVPAPEEWISTQASDRPAPPEADPAATDEALFDADQVSGASPAAQAHPADEPADELADEPATDHETPAAASKRKPRKTAPGKGRGKGRASVPSWDEIMFGSGRGD